MTSFGRDPSSFWLFCRRFGRFWRHQIALNRCFHRKNANMPPSKAISPQDQQLSWVPSVN
jgi:hypothetical protein